MRCVHREPLAPSAEEARAVRYPSLAILRTVGHRANALQLRSPARSRERNVDPTTRGARRGSVFTTTARPHPRNTSSFGSRSALTQRRRGPIRIELGGGAPHLSPDLHRLLQRERATRVEECRARTPCGGAAAKCVDRGRANPVVKEEHPVRQIDAARRIGVRERLASRRVARFSRSGRAPPAFSSGRRVGPRGLWRPEDLARACLATDGHARRTASSRACVNCPELHGDGAPLLDEHRCSSKLLLVDLNPEHAPERRVTSYTLGSHPTCRPPKATSDEPRASSGSPAAPSARARAWLRGGPSCSNASTLRHAAPWSTAWSSRC